MAVPAHGRRPRRAPAPAATPAATTPPGSVPGDRAPEPAPAAEAAPVPGAGRAARTPAAPALRRSRPGPLLRAAAGLLGLGLAAGLLGAAHTLRPVPYGDRLLSGEPGNGRPAARTWAPRVRGAAVVGYDARGDAPRWRYARAGRRPAAVAPVPGEVVVLWDDGLLTATDGRSVRWHRALPDAAEWLPARGGAGVLRPLGRGILAVVTPHRVTAYRTADGDLRWVLPARSGCAFRPGGAVRRGPALLLAQPCDRAAWTGQLVAVDDLGRITPDRTPLDSGPPGRAPERVEPEKPLARPR
ncbi:hypothetical protein [Streptomyces sp. NPDC006193]|uniref:hypothetical protein n=1 Tax=Streptomyces sp. NPDC006193 TaxID=3155717 RepID=UPI0033B6446F